MTVIEQLENYNNWIHWIHNITYDRDGCSSAESLGKLVDEVYKITCMAIKNEKCTKEGPNES